MLGATAKDISLVYLESIRDNADVTRTDFFELLRQTTVHEIGHQFRLAFNL